ncbi:hypothetical protein [Tepidibacter hydrothermalis]|uniref:Small, acid-soluble spore protein, alpha/beta type n=1 Tax=Tepidibacter hydrothermalis TaxID=3036126 RepID=A0ABY8EFU6_9FIRM|nr:hypothetical protein [Tepidibacter hydrothermalis]WFD11829.1 hypothetical protein P4S50_07055 [Tepidibacter hydrothermalis]
MAGKNKQFNKQDKKIAEKIENMNLETANELGVDEYNTNIGYRKQNNKKGPKARIDQ